MLQSADVLGLTSHGSGVCRDLKGRSVSGFGDRGAFVSV